MGMISGLQKFFGFTPSRWMGVDQIKSQTIGLKDLLKQLFKTKKPQRTETFEQALARLNLTEQDLQKRDKEFQFLTRCFGLISLVLILYFIYLLFRHAWWPAVGTFGILLIMIAHLIRYHFWLFQIRQRRLGCTLGEWFNNLRGRKP